MAGKFVNGSNRKGVISVTAVAPDDDPALQIVAQKPNRISLTIYNHSATVTMFLGPSDVTAATGFPLAPGELFEDDDTEAAWYGITSSGTGDLRVIEVSG